MVFTGRPHPQDPRRRPFALRSPRAGPGVRRPSAPRGRAERGRAPSTPANARRIAAFRRSRTASASASTSSSRPYPARGQVRRRLAMIRRPAHLLAGAPSGGAKRPRLRASMVGSSKTRSHAARSGPKSKSVPVFGRTRLAPCVAGRRGIDSERVRQHDPVVPGARLRARRSRAPRRFAPPPCRARRGSPKPEPPGVSMVTVWPRSRVSELRCRASARRAVPGPRSPSSAGRAGPPAPPREESGYGRGRRSREWCRRGGLSRVSTCPAPPRHRPAPPGIRAHVVFPERDAALRLHHLEGMVVHGCSW